MLRVYINGNEIPYTTFRDSIKIDDAIDERSTMSCTIIDIDNQYTFKKGQKIEVYDDDVLEFSGIIEKSVKQKVSPGNSMIHALSSIDWHRLADKRVIAKAYTEELAGDIVRDIISEKLEAEGVTIGEIQDGPLIQEAVFNYVRVTDALNSLAEKSGFWWMIDYDKKLYFVAKTTYTALFPISGVDMEKNSVSVEQGNPMYRNRQYVKGGLDITDPQTQRFVGDGVLQSFVVGYPFAKQPSVSLTRAALTFGGTDYIDIPSEITSDLGGKEICSFKAKIRPNNVDHVACLISMGMPNNITRFEVALNSSRQIRVGGRSQTGDPWQSVTTVNALEFGQWYDIEAGIDIKNNVGFVYVNGESWTTTGSISWATNEFTTETGLCKLGARIFNDYFYFGVMQNAQLLIDGVLLAYWPLNDGEFDKILDYGSKEYHGQVIGATWTIGQTESQTVGIRGVEENKDWYWSKGSNIITQETNGIPLSFYDQLSITYQGEFDIVILTESPQEIAERQSIEGSGTGYVENVFEDSNNNSRQAAFETANSKLNKYSIVGNRLRFKTYRKGLQPGQILTVSLPEYGLQSAELLIDKVKVGTEESGKLIYYDIQAVKGPTYGNWTKMFYQMATQGQAFVIRENIKEDQILITVASFNKTWQESEAPNIFKVVYPGSSTFPVNLYPSFEPEHRIQYISWYINGVENGRKQITQQTGLDTDTIFTLVLIASYEANVNISHIGWWGGWQATDELGTGIEIDKQVYEKNKTGIEGIQIEKTDSKGW